MGPRRSATYPVRGSIALLLLVTLTQGCTRPYHTFADYPGFEEYYRDRCVSPPAPPSERDLELLRKYRPRFVLPPGGAYPVDFYRD
ncbi:MAG: hypothetical protein JSV00_05100, partial [bacterium]